MIPLKIKDGVRITKLHPEMVRVLPTIGQAFEKQGAKEYVITSGEEGNHMVGSLHPEGKALDFRNWAVSETRVPAVVRALKARLGPDFDVVSEPTHIHIEFDPK